MKEPQTEPHWVYRAEAESLEASGHVGAEKGTEGCVFQRQPHTCTCVIAYIILYTLLIMLTDLQ